MLKTPRKQFIVLLDSFIQGDILETEGLWLILLRQIKGGDVSVENLYLAESLLDLATKHR